MVDQSVPNCANLDTSEDIATKFGIVAPEIEQEVFVSVWKTGGGEAEP